MEMYHWWAEEVAQGSRLGEIVARVFRPNLLETHRDYLDNCARGIDHQDAVDGTRQFAHALYGGAGNDPYWSNNERRWAGRGPMPIRRLLRYRHEQLSLMEGKA